MSVFFLFPIKKNKNKNYHDKVKAEKCVYAWIAFVETFHAHAILLGQYTYV